MIDTFEQELIAMNESFNVQDQAMINGLDTIYALENTIDSDSDYFMEETNSKKENPIVRFFKFIIAQIKKFASQISQKVQNWINVHKFKSLLERIHRMKYNGAKTVEIPDLDKLYNVTEKSSKEILKYCDQIIDRCKSGKFKKADVEKMQNYMEKQAEKYKAEEKAILDKHIKYDIKKALSMVEKYLSILTKKDPVIAETESRLNKMMSAVEHYDFSKDTSSPSDVTGPIQKGISFIRNHRIAFTSAAIAAGTAIGVGVAIGVSKLNKGKKVGTKGDNDEWINSVVNGNDDWLDSVFGEDIKSGNTERITKRIENLAVSSVFVDSLKAKKFDECISYIKRNAPNTFKKLSGPPLASKTKSKFTEADFTDALNQLKQNLCQERIDDLIAIGRSLYRHGEKKK